MKIVRPSTSAATLFAALVLPQAAQAACDNYDGRRLIVDDNCSYVTGTFPALAVWSRGATNFDVTNRIRLWYYGPASDGPVDFKGSTDFSFTNEAEVETSGGTGIYVRDSSRFRLVNAGSITGSTGIAILDSSDFELINSGTIDGRGTAMWTTGVERFYLLNTETGVIQGRSYGSSLDMNGTGPILIENYGRIEQTVRFRSAAQMANAGYVFALDALGGSLDLYQAGYIGNLNFTVGGNALYLEPDARFGSSIEFNNTADNSLYFAPGSYTLAVKGFAEDDNNVTLYNRYQSLVVTGDPADEAVLDVVQSNGASALTGAIGLQIGAISDIIGGVAPQGGSSGGSTALDYASVPALTGAAAAVSELAGSSQYDATRFFWLNGFGGGGRDRASLMDTAHAGLVAGYEIHDGAMRAGFLGGIGQLSNDGPAGTGSVDADTAFAGAYYGEQHGAYDIDALLIAGGLRAKTTRGVNAGDPATGSYDGWYIAPEIAVSRTLALADGWSLTPGARLRYVGTWLDGYTETGSVQNVSYDDRSSHVVEGSLEVRLGKTHSFENGMDMRLDLSAALVESLNLGDSDFDATLINTAFTTSAFTDRSVTGGRFGMSAELKVDEGISLYGGGKLGVYSDDSWAWSANGGVKAAF